MIVEDKARETTDEVSKIFDEVFVLLKQGDGDYVNFEGVLDFILRSIGLTDLLIVTIGDASNHDDFTSEQRKMISKAIDSGLELLRDTLRKTEQNNNRNLI